MQYASFGAPPRRQNESFRSPLLANLDSNSSSFIVSTRPPRLTRYPVILESIAIIHTACHHLAVQTKEQPFPQASGSSCVLFNPRNPPACEATAPTANSRLRCTEFGRDTLVSHAIRRHQHNLCTRNATRLRTAPRDHASKVLRSSSDKVMTGAIFMSSILL